MHDYDPLYDHLLATELSWRACAAAGVKEAPLPIMRYERYRAILKQQGIVPEPGSFQLMARTRLASNAQAARRTLSRNPSLVRYYELRQLARDMGGDPDTVPRPDIRRGPKPAAPDEVPVVPVDEWARLEELAARPLHNVTGHRYGERPARGSAKWEEIRFERRQLHQENFEIRQARQALAQRRRALERAARLSDKSAATTARRGAAVSARGELARRTTWVEQALADLQACTDQGRAIPVAARHLHGAVPLPLRPRFRHNIG